MIKSWIGTLNQKLRCPYCKGKQEYKSKDYFSAYESLSVVQCDHCDQNFHAMKEINTVETFSNLIVPKRLSK